MAPPPPQQAGKFKPRRPAPASKKKAVATPIAVGSSSNTAQRSTSGGRGGGGRGRGREGGGRGRGGGRFPAPRGAVFFTGGASGVGDNKKPTAASAAAAAASNRGVQNKSSHSVTMPGASSSSSSRRGASAGASMIHSLEGEGEEIVIGEIEGGGVGSKAIEVEAKREGREGQPSMFAREDEDQPEGAFAAESTYIYDSDSSEDEKSTNRRQQRDTAVPPSQLPFPVPVLPRGVGGENRPNVFMYDCQNTEEKKDESAPMGEDPPTTSPFIDWDRATPNDRLREQNMWMMLKLPTRLPQLDTRARNMGVKSESVKIDEGLLDMDAPDAVPSGEEIAVTAGVDLSTIGASGGGGCFDDTLKDAPAGRYGKILVYKSGKTVMVVGNVRMVVREGLQCGFNQQAVAIDPNMGTYIPLGEVKKSLVVTPDVEHAFATKK